MAENEKKIDKNGCEYMDHLPEDYRPAVLGDFHYQGSRNYGLEFLIQWADNPNKFQVCIVSENLTAAFLKPFIEAGRVFIKK